MIYHTYRECLGMEPAAGSIAVAAGGKDSDRKEDCQICLLYTSDAADE